jgi:acetamidase/formamidase
MVNAVSETVEFLSTTKGLSREEAYSLTALAVDCRVSQVVDIRKGVHCMIPKSLWVGKAVSVH